MTRDQLRSLRLNRAVVEKLRLEPDAVIQRGRRNLETLRAIHAEGPVTASWDAWERLLHGPVEGVAVLEAETDEAIQLRQNSPFAGVLTSVERSQALADFRAAQA